MLRVAFADVSDRATLLQAIAACRATVEQQYNVGKQHVTEQLDGVAPYPERASLNSVWWVLIGEQHRLMLRWLDWAATEVQAWQNTRPQPFDARLHALATRLVAGRPIL